MSTLETLQSAEAYLVSAVTALSGVVVIFWRGQARAYARLERRAAECDRRAAECDARAAALSARLEEVLARVALLESLRDDH